MIQMVILEPRCINKISVRNSNRSLTFTNYQQQKSRNSLPKMIQIVWGKTQNAKLVILNGHQFPIKLDTQFTTHRKCVRWPSHQRKVTMITIEDALLNVEKEHNNQVVPGHSVTRQTGSTDEKKLWWRNRVP